MTVACKMSFCPYHKDNFCCKDVVCIDENGHCSEIWRKGKRREQILYDVVNGKEIKKCNELKKPIILEGEIKDVTT